MDSTRLEAENLAQGRATGGGSPDEAAKWRKELDSAKIDQERTSKPPQSSSK